MNKVYLITGASSEVGMAYIKKLDETVSENVTVVAHYANNKAGLEALQKELSYVTLRLVQADLSIAGGAGKVCAFVKEQGLEVTHMLHLAASAFLHVKIKKWDEENRISNWNKILQAVNETRGKIITYDGKPINAFFHANSGGKTQVPLYVWGGSGYPYLQVVETSGEDKYSQYSSEAKFSKKEFIQKIKEKHEDFKIDFDEKECIKIIKRDESNRVITVKIGNLNLSGVETRTLLGLRSANFTVEIKEDEIKFKVIGYGHGVGMSQTGADALAKQGKDYREIIEHFYFGVEIKEM